MFSIINDYKIAGISLFSSCSSPPLLSSLLFSPRPAVSLRYLIGRRWIRRLGFVSHSSVIPGCRVYRLDAPRPASRVEKRGEYTEIEIPMCYLNGFDIFRHRLITDEQGNRRIGIFIEILLGVRIEGAVEIDLALRLPRRHLLVD